MGDSSFVHCCSLLKQTQTNLRNVEKYEVFAGFYGAAGEI